MAVLYRVSVLLRSVPDHAEIKERSFFHFFKEVFVCHVIPAISIQPHLVVSASYAILVWQDNTANGNDNAATKPNRYGLKMSIVPLPCSFIAVGATVTKEPASFAADDTSSNTSHVGDLRQPTTDTALAVSLQSKA